MATQPSRMAMSSMSATYQSYITKVSCADIWWYLTRGNQGCAPNGETIHMGVVTLARPHAITTDIPRRCGGLAWAIVMSELQRCAPLGTAFQPRTVMVLYRRGPSATHNARFCVRKPGEWAIKCDVWPVEMIARL
jgi:hypothetical protein